MFGFFQRKDARRLGSVAQYLVFDEGRIDVFGSLPKVIDLFKKMEDREKVSVLVGMDCALIVRDVFGDAFANDNGRAASDADFIEFLNAGPHLKSFGASHQTKVAAVASVTGIHLKSVGIAHLKSFGVAIGFVLRRACQMSVRDAGDERFLALLIEVFSSLLDHRVRDLRPEIASSGWKVDTLVSAHRITNASQYFDWLRAVLPPSVSYNDEIYYLINPAFRGMSRAQYREHCKEADSAVPTEKKAFAVPLHFKSNQAAFEMASKYLDTKLGVGKSYLAMVSDPRPLEGRKNGERYSVEKIDNGCYIVPIEIAGSSPRFSVSMTFGPNARFRAKSASGDYEEFTTEIGASQEVDTSLSVGDLVLWKVEKVISEKEDVYIGLIVAKIKPEYVDSRWAAVCFYVPNIE